LKRFLMFLALGAGLLSCSESLTTRTSAGLAGTYDLALAGRYLFVTSSDRNELRVLDLQGSPRDFVRAPNPLEALSIPVLDRPSNLTSDVVFAVEILKDREGEGGQEISRQLVQDTAPPYVYARSFGSREISIVASHDLSVEDDPVRFQERHRLTGEGLVTALAARGPVRERTRTQATEDTVVSDVVSASFGQSVLYYAVQTGRDAKLYRVALPAPSQLTKESILTPQPLELALTGSTVTALLVLPPPAGQPGQESLVVATRSTTGASGETFRVEVNNTQATRGITYAFEAPVRLLATHPRAEVTKENWYQCSFDPESRDASGEPLPPAPLAGGQYIFGVLDENSCSNQQSCSGVVAVESATGARATDATGLPMLPISVGQALPTGLVMAEAVDVRLPCQIQVDPVRVLPIVNRPLVGIVPASNGTITLFDAVRMRPFDLDAAGASASFNLVDSTGTSKNIPAEVLSTHLKVEVLEGVTQNDTYRVLYQFSLPDLAAVARTEVACPTSTADRCFAVDAGAATRVEPGDVLVLRGDAGTCKDATGTEVDFIIQSKVAAAGSPTILVTTPPAALPEDCNGLPRLIVRAAGARPFAVYSDAKGFLGRLGDRETLEVSGTYYYQPTAALDPAPKDVRITVESIARELGRGDQYVVTTSSHFLPYVFAPDVGSVSAGLAAYRLPGPVVYARVGTTDFAYIAYPSADGILQIALETIRDNAANTTGLVPFE
jgi:hypothetical protein